MTGGNCNGAADNCNGGACEGTGTAACDDGNSCTSDSCNEAADSCAGATLPDGTPCSDGDACTLDDLCTVGVCVGDETLVESDLRIAPDSIIGDDIVSAGSGAEAFPGSGFLPYLDPPTSTLAPGSLVEKADATGFYDLTGTHPLAASCPKTPCFTCAAEAAASPISCWAQAPCCVRRGE
ncbi:MAG: hypothetical protein ABR538_01940 [Candidatus Binatia bacterium]